MNRREMTRLLALAGVGIAGGTGLGALRGERPRSVYLLTDDPDGDLARLQSVFGASAGLSRVDVWPVSPSAQDLTIVGSEGIVDPCAKVQVPAMLRRMALELRARRTPATTLLAVSGDASNSADLLITRGGLLWDRLDGAARYERIEVPVPQGRLVMRLENRRLTVVEAPCRHKLCQRMGARHSGAIVCAPNQFIATIGGGAFDGISG